MNDDIRARDIVGLAMAAALFVGSIVWMALTPSEAGYEADANAELSGTVASATTVS